ncbi:MAG: helix-turn-helix domain-containing protein [Candidatus Gracilibacteria bacterium]|nr:helix-turn-helix domain-containing protein [Candidatus Gracilibacteria bacterium]
MELNKYIQNALTEFGLTEGEALLYIIILQTNGYADATYLQRAAKYSSAGTYKILNSLINKGFIFPNESRPVSYTAVSLDEISKKSPQKVENFAEQLENLLNFQNCPTPRKEPQSTKITI